MKLPTYAAIGLMGAAALYAYSSLHQPAGNLREFDPDAVAAYETAMWKSYYAHERVQLFVQLLSLLREQYHQPPVKAIVTGYHAARAAAIFQPGHNRAEYEKALPDLVAYYGYLLPAGADAGRAASLELEWWIAHRERARLGQPAVEASLAAVQEAIYGVPKGRLAQHAAFRAEAMTIRDTRAERGRLTAADWNEIQELLHRSWHELHSAVH